MNDRTDVLGRRVGAALLDIVVLFGVFVVIGATIGNAQASGSSFSVSLNGASAGLFFLLVALYYFVPETMTGQTLGKRLLSIRVVRVDGSAPGAGPVAARTLLRIIDALPVFYLLGFIVALATGSGRRQRIGDLAAGTQVVAA